MALLKVMALLKDVDEQKCNTNKVTDFNVAWNVT